MNAAPQLHLVVLEPFARIPLDLLDVSALLVLMETHPLVAVLEAWSRNADLMHSVVKARLALLVLVNAFAEEVMTGTLPQEDVKTSMNVWPVPSLSVVLMLFAKIFLEAMSVSVLKASVAILSIGARNALQGLVPVNLLMSWSMISVNWLDVQATETASQARHSALKSLEESATVLALLATRLVLKVNALTLMNAQMA